MAINDMMIGFYRLWFLVMVCGHGEWFLVNSREWFEVFTLEWLILLNSFKVLLFE